ncbi:MerR family transcriptional regulator [Neorhizobium sp. P12A]|uniref:MerR family transcriptional regulator n=1 Tax=Neorhizobium sp. P12A TaxID=2268027 RepID=UPI0011EF4B0D|nr:MerR family transcriptional regulator [Neorhizobium sp. P12A]KAA0686465.1 MerR family transcriptional regulator [Neorhizobium sp. P12A]
MVISEFAIAAGLSRDTIRFYVRLGLLQPQTTAKGGRRPYQMFSAEDVQAARIVRTAQSLGMSLKEIADIAKERREGRMTRERSVEVLRGQLDLLEKKAQQLQAMVAYLRDKIIWMESGETEPMADFGRYLSDALPEPVIDAASKS